MNGSVVFNSTASLFGGQNGQRVLIGSQRAEELAEAIELARGSGPADASRR